MKAWVISVHQGPKVLTQFPRPKTQLIAVLSVAVNLSLLLFFAATTDLWDDEVNAFFLARQPTPQWLGYLSLNYYEDPPAFYLIEALWIKIAGYQPFLLRLLPFGLWLICLLGVKRLAEHLGGEAGRNTALIVVALWPYHWTYPIALRWYSLAAALLIWNLYFFVQFVERAVLPTRSRLALLSLGSLIVITCGLLWYTSYAAPAYFLALIVTLILTGSLSRTTLFGGGAIGLSIFLLYLPWVRPFLTQLSISLFSRFSLPSYLASISALISGDFSVPTAPWISLPLFIFFLSSLILATKNWAISSWPLSVAGVLFISLSIAGVMGPKRLLMVTAPLGAGIGLAISSEFSKQKRRNLPLIALVLVAFVGLAGTLYNAVSRTDWLTYRWLDRTSDAIEVFETKFPHALLLSNANPVAFYARDPFGLHLALNRLEQDPSKAVEVRVWNTQARALPSYGSLMEAQILQSDTVVYIHHAGLSIGPIQELDQVLTWLCHLGFRQSASWQVNPMSDGGLADILDFSDYPTHRLTLLMLRKTSRQDCPNDSRGSIKLPEV